MSIGHKIQTFVEELKAVDFPVHSVPGGDIHRVLSKNLSFVESIQELHSAAMSRRKAKEAVQRSLNRVRA